MGLTKLEKELIELTEETYDNLCETEKQLNNELEKNIHSSEPIFKDILDRISRHREKMEDFAKKKGEIFRNIFNK